MISRVLIVGMSHVGAIRMGWGELGADDRPDYDFFACSVRAADHVGLLPDGRLGLLDVPGVTARMRSDVLTINGRETVDLTPYDTVVSVGHPLGQQSLIQLLLAVGVQGLRAAPQPMQAVLSRPALRAFVGKILAATWPAKTVSAFAGKRLALVTRPLRSEASAQVPDEGGELARAMQAAPEGLARLMAPCFEDMAASCAERGVTLLAQPPETIGEFGLTREAFNRGSVGLSGKPRDGLAQFEQDRAHMNAASGRKVLDQIAAWLPSR